VHGEGRREEKERDWKSKCADRTICFHITYQETKFYGHSPRERVNHVDIVVMCD
jgi:hypothetical protein